MRKKRSFDFRLLKNLYNSALSSLIEKESNFVKEKLPDDNYDQFRLSLKGPFASRVREQLRSRINCGRMPGKISP